MTRTADAANRVLKLPTPDKLRLAADFLEKGDHEIGLMVARWAVEELEWVKLTAGDSGAWKTKP